MTEQASGGSGSGAPLPRPGKVVLIVCDSLGVGEAPDAGDYGDEGADTVGHAAAAVGGLALPTLESWGFGRLTRIAGVTHWAPILDSEINDDSDDD